MRSARAPMCMKGYPLPEDNPPGTNRNASGKRSHISDLSLVSRNRLLRSRSYTTAGRTAAD